ncbi:HD domain-containing protein [Pseudalkalibacillus caeni]|uniref:HD domain-containing protein n=1 Tax=Exobacillus caeni TaxID=2574798 RepID=A0A5R9FBI6_9BACL|nr:HD domain-containing protein [Pseudalkalibacillus caeni]TLS37904.1 HD domain-containing protein [Pseudalkalibacillus caeni]
MDKQAILQAAESYVKKELSTDSSGHDWWHIYRVRNTALTIARNENADLFICELAALLHDIADEKLNESEEAGLKKVQDWLIENKVEKPYIDHVIQIISTMSFKGGNRQPMETLEGKVVQDADRLDALGAVGIARTFAYAGSKGDLVYAPELKPRTSLTKESYRNGRSTAVNHFYEKLLKLKDLMNTEYAKTLADERHRFMELYLEQFFSEWEGEK